MQAIIIIACVIACVHHIWCWVCAQTKSVMASRSRMYFLRFCCVKAWKGLNYVTSWVKTSSLAIPILFTRKTVWYKYCAIGVVFSCSLVDTYCRGNIGRLVLSPSPSKFYFMYVKWMYSKCLNRDLLRDLYKLCLFLGGCTGAAQFSKYIP